MLTDGPATVAGHARYLGGGSPSRSRPPPAMPRGPAAISSSPQGPAKLQFVKTIYHPILGMPGTVAAGKPISPAVAVGVTDDLGNLVTSDRHGLGDNCRRQQFRRRGDLRDNYGPGCRGRGHVQEPHDRQGGDRLHACGHFGNLQPSPPSNSFQVTATAEWTVLVYGDGDNNLEAEEVYAIQQMEKVGSTARSISWSSSIAAHEDTQDRIGNERPRLVRLLAQRRSSRVPATRASGLDVVRSVRERGQGVQHGRAEHGRL